VSGNGKKGISVDCPGGAAGRVSKKNRGGNMVPSVWVGLSFEKKRKGKEKEARGKRKRTIYTVSKKRGMNPWERWRGKCQRIQSM